MFGIRKHLFIVVYLLGFSIGYAQEIDAPKKEPARNSSQTTTNNRPGESGGSQSTSNQKAPVAKIDQYKIISKERDTILLDTSLTIQKDYRHNYWRTDQFGYMPFSNEGQVRNRLYYGRERLRILPSMGFQAKHHAYQEIEDIHYYQVATPLTDIYFRTVLEQGQSVDALVTLNTSERTNYSISYRGLRSLGRYLNQLSSIGNFRFTATHQTEDKRYGFRIHFTGQDITNGENGGLINETNFTEGLPNFENRARIAVFSEDAQSFLKGNRIYMDHNYQLNSKGNSTPLKLFHEFHYERKHYDYTQGVLPIQISIPGQTPVTIIRFGESYVVNNVKDKTKFNQLYNKAGILFDWKGKADVSVFTEDFRSSLAYNRVILFPDDIIPSGNSISMNTLGGTISTHLGKWNFDALLSQSVRGDSQTLFKASSTYHFTEREHLKLKWTSLSKIPDHTFQLFQSSFVHYNWKNEFKNQLSNTLEAHFLSRWVDVDFIYENTTNFLYFSDVSDQDFVQLISPLQTTSPINYISLKASKELKWRKFALDNTLLWQRVEQSESVLNVPDLVARNTFYYSNHFFKKALFLQAGVTLNYFSSYYADEYNPILGTFFVQSDRKIGDFPLVDVFINAKIRTARLYFKAEHINAGMTGLNYFSSPGQPYRDFVFRFGLEWNFFQ
jgi:hypothetical protein